MLKSTVEMRCGVCRELAFIAVLYRGVEVDFKCQGCGELNSVKLETPFSLNAAPGGWTERGK